MDLNTHSYTQNGKVRICSNDTTSKQLDTNSSKSMREDTPVGLVHNERNDYENTEHISSLPTVFEGKMSVRERKLSSREQLSNIVNLRKSGSSHDIRGEDLRPLSPFFSRCSSQESLDDNLLIRSTGVRMLHRKISSPLPTSKMIRRRALSETPAEALISPVIPRRYLSSKQLRTGVSRVKSCPIISADSNEHLNNSSPSPPFSPRFTFEVSSGSAQPQNRSVTKFYATPVSACPTLKNADQEKLPRINQTRCSPMLVSAHKIPTESARELFNVSPVMGESADSINRHNNNNHCDVTDKVQYFLHTISAEENIDQY